MTDLAAAPPAVETRLARPLLVLHLRGDQVTMGHQHGALLRAHGGHEATLAYYARMPELLMGPAHGGPHPLVLRPVLELLLRRLDRDRPRALRERTRAFMEALGQPRAHGRHVFVMDLLQNVVGLAGRWGLGPTRDLFRRAAVPACSSVAVWGDASSDATLRHARNFDFPGAGLWDRHPAVVFCDPQGEPGPRYGFVTTRGADTPGVTGFNEAGLTVTAHTRFHADVRWSGAGIIDLTHDIVRRATSIDDAARIARERPVASTWGIIVSSARERSAAVLEVTGRAVEVVRPRAGEDFLLQTNRYASCLCAGEVAPSVGFVMNSDGRARVIRRHVERARAAGGMDVDALQTMLGAHDDPDVEGAARAAGGVLAQGISVQSVVVEPEARCVHVSVGPCPTGGGPWRAVDWDWSAPVGARVVDQEARPHPAPAPYRTGQRRRAHERFVDAVVLEGQGAPEASIAAAVEDAVALDPDDPTYRLIAGAFRLRQGDVARALDCLKGGLPHERAPFHRGQLLLWAARAADALGHEDEARALRAELAALVDPLLLDHHRAATQDARRPWTAARLRRVMVHMSLPDVVA